MHVETLELDVGRRAIDVELYVPGGDGPFPGVLLLHELLGLNSNVRADARSLARAGYITMAPDLFSGRMGRYCMKMFFTRDALANAGSSTAVGEVHRCLDHLKAHRSCNEKLGMIGMCLTGGFVLQMARRDDMAAPVVYHHSLGVRGSGIPRSEAADIATTVQGHYGELDRYICPRQRVESLKDQLGDRLEVHWYAGVGHGIRSAFRYTPQSEQAWTRTLGFFDQNLR